MTAANPIFTTLNPPARNLISACIGWSSQARRCDECGAIIPPGIAAERCGMFDPICTACCAKLAPVTAAQVSRLHELKARRA